MKKLRYSLLVRVLFLVLFSMMSCKCTANTASSIVRRAYDGTKYLVRTVHETLGTAGIIGCISAVSVLTFIALYKYYFAPAPQTSPMLLETQNSGEKLCSLLPAPHEGRSKHSATDKVFHGVRIRLVAGDIVTQHVDIIVNAANEHLTGGGGVDGAIQDAAGPELAAYCIKNFPTLGTTVSGVPIRCPVGEVRVTPAFGLSKQNVKFLIHANGPLGSMPNRENLLASCYQNALAEANRLKATSIAFPAISVGIFGYPIEEAAACAVRTVAEMIQKTQSNTIREIRFVLYENDPHHQELLKSYRAAMATYLPAC